MRGVAISFRYMVILLPILFPKPDSFQLTRSDSPALLAQSLRTTSTLFSTLLPHLKLQLELFLSYVIDRLTPPTSSPFPMHLANPTTLSRPSSPAVSNGPIVDGGVAVPDGETPSSNGPSIGTHTPTASTPRPLSMLPPVPNETKELMLESLAQIALRPSFMVDCWVNFDCSTESEDMFERLISFLTRASYHFSCQGKG
jgi:brefeldin A-resistance guanine nucleotide exchange factor 1